MCRATAFLLHHSLFLHARIYQRHPLSKKELRSPRGKENAYKCLAVIVSLRILYLHSRLYLPPLEVSITYPNIFRSSVYLRLYYSLFLHCQDYSNTLHRKNSKVATDKKEYESYVQKDPTDTQPSCSVLLLLYARLTAHARNSAVFSAPATSPTSMQCSQLQEAAVSSHPT